jgi:polyribonucleotide nucleotidyltransferase
MAEGDVVKVKLIGLDPKTGKFKLSRKALMPKPEGMPDRPPRDENREARGPIRVNKDREQKEDNPE